MRNVVITGMGIYSDLGTDLDTIYNNMSHANDMTTLVLVKVSKTRTIEYPVHLINREKVQKELLEIPRELERTFTPMSLFAYKATTSALIQSKLFNENKVGYYDRLKIGISVANGSPSIGTFEKLFLDTMKDNPKNMPTGDIFKTINNNVAVNLAHAFNIGGRVICASSACATSLQSIILGYEAIRNGYVDMMICGGTEEYHPYFNFIFNKLGIASKTSCKPFQKTRDGIIVGEGAGIFILEAEDIARNRGANIIADVLGGGMTFSQQSAFSDSKSILECMLQATQRSRIEFIDAIDAHATGTPMGDDTEAEAIREYNKLYPGTVMKTTALKGFFGHTMAACGAIELAMSIYLAKKDKQKNVCTQEELDESCYGASIYTDDTPSAYPFILKNSFGLGGVNTSLLVAMR